MTPVKPAEYLHTALPMRQFKSTLYLRFDMLRAHRVDLETDIVLKSVVLD